MKPHTDSFDSSISDELRQVRTDALDHTASAIRSIRRQKELTMEEGIEGIGEIVTAESSAEDAMFFLAAAMSLETGSPFPTRTDDCAKVDAPGGRSRRHVVSPRATTQPLSAVNKSAACCVFFR